jgi:hypothetical protein
MAGSFSGNEVSIYFDFANIIHNSCNFQALGTFQCMAEDGGFATPQEAS